MTTVRAVIALVVLSGALLATGTGFAAAARVKAGAIQQLQGGLRSSSASACAQGGAACGQLDAAARQHDAYANAAIGFMVAGGVTAVAAGASIWIVRTPAHAVEITPALPGALAAVTLKGSW